eukprot:TRINITY_DN3700_c0_g1_i1.p1 TRINITY_DN3700_c0_g1~~TRINITY_DN3700_c0_g1_i1.p1  ORF type:complete len:375 (-),score=141.13 TRINITY_DN3700_c0_g1_i1:165-1289(-)
MFAARTRALTGLRLLLPSRPGAAAAACFHARAPPSSAVFAPRGGVASPVSSARAPSGDIAYVDAGKMRYSSPGMSEQEGAASDAAAASEAAGVHRAVEDDLSGYVGRLYGSCIVTRLPTLTPDLPDWEVRYEEHWLERENALARLDPDEKDAKKKMANQTSKKAQKKMKRAEEKKKAKQLAAEQKALEADPEALAKAKAKAEAEEQKRKEAEEKERKKAAANATTIDDEYVPASRTTKADRMVEVHSLQRALAQRLYLIVRPASPSVMHATMGDWVFPYGEWELGESMRKTAHRNLRDICGKGLRIYVYGNAPHGHLPLADAEDKTVFFHEARHLAGNPKMSSAYKDYAWVTKAEMEQYFSDDFFAYTQRLLWD